MGTPGSSLAIVAVPSREDRVWKISSEDVPHMTILYLGDQSENPNLQHIVEFVGHVAKTTMTRFGMSIDRRGTLGPKDADVLFFMDQYAEAIQEMRDDLLKDVHIRTAFETTEQFDGFIPHLTLGYPDKPAKKDDRDYGIGYVSFDTIQVWIDGSAGPEFRLHEEYYNDMPLLHAEVDEEIETFLAHYGVKGMRWGVNKASRAASNSPEVSVSQKPGKRVKAVGGKARPASDDAKAAATAKQIAKKSTTDALSNKELQSLVTRMNLEKQLADLQKGDPTANRGQKFVNRLLGKNDKNTRMSAADMAVADRLREEFDKRNAA